MGMTQNKTTIRRDFAKTEKPKDYLKEKKVGEQKDFLPYIQGVTNKIAKHLKKKSSDSVTLAP